MSVFYGEDQLILINIRVHWKGKTRDVKEPIRGLVNESVNARALGQGSAFMVSIELSSSSTVFVVKFCL